MAMSYQDVLMMSWNQVLYGQVVPMHTHWMGSPMARRFLWDYDLLQWIPA